MASNGANLTVGAANATAQGAAPILAIAADLAMAIVRRANRAHSPQSTFVFCREQRL
jgi:hypothetical protein